MQLTGLWDWRGYEWGLPFLSIDFRNETSEG